MDLKEINSVLQRAGDAVGKGSISLEEIKELRGALREIDESLSSTPIELAVKASARVLNTRLKHVSKQRFLSKDGAITPRTLSALPVQNQVEFGKRLKRQASRAEVALKKQKEQKVAYDSAAFKCKADYDSCRRSSSGHDKMWCHLAMVLCLISSVATLKLSFQS